MKALFIINPSSGRQNFIKGIEEIVIIPTNKENVNVVLKSSEKISDEKIAQIQQIIVDQLGVKANKLSITVK